MTSSVDYQRTSRRPEFASLPAAVREAIGEAAGSPVRGADPVVTSGFTGAYAGLLTLADGRRVFAKAAGPSMPHVVEALDVEAAVLPKVAVLRCASRLIGCGSVDADDGRWAVLVLESIDGRMPGTPWTPDDARRTLGTLTEIAECPSPEVVTTTQLRTELDIPAVATIADQIAAGELRWPAGFPTYSASIERELGALARRLPSVCAGGQLQHTDLRGDNLLVEPGGLVRALDWNWVALGAPWVDLGLLLGHWHDAGIPAVLWEHSDLLSGVAADDLDALLAWAIAFMAKGFDAPPPPGCTEALRDHGRHSARTWLALLAERRGWH